MALQEGSGPSRQDYQTPPNFIEAVVKRFGPLGVDLAGSHANAQAPLVITPEHDSLSLDWAEFDRTRWLNPPFAHIKPWVARCAALEWDPHPTLLLVPASVGSEWWAQYVDMRAAVRFCRPRLTFVGCDQPYPRDIALCCYGGAFDAKYECWRWR